MRDLSKKGGGAVAWLHELRAPGAAPWEGDLDDLSHFNLFSEDAQ